MMLAGRYAFDFSYISFRSLLCATTRPRKFTSTAGSGSIIRIHSFGKRLSISARVSTSSTRILQTVACSLVLSQLAAIHSTSRLPPPTRQIRQPRRGRLVERFHPSDVVCSLNNERADLHKEAPGVAGADAQTADRVVLWEVDADHIRLADEQRRQTTRI